MMARASVALTAVALGACGAPGTDADAGPLADAGLPDAGAVDAGAPDAGAFDAGSPDAGPSTLFQLTSPMLEDGGMIPVRYTCTDATTIGHVSIPLGWTPSPDAGSYALIMTDTTINLIHWVIWDIQASTLELPEGVENVAQPASPPGAKQTTSYDNTTFGYRGPCPPNVHVYRFELSALDVATLPGVTTASTRSQVQTALAPHVQASTSLAGRYGP